MAVFKVTGVSSVKSHFKLALPHALWLRIVTSLHCAVCCNLESKVKSVNNKGLEFKLTICACQDLEMHFKCISGIQRLEAIYPGSLN